MKTKKTIKGTCRICKQEKELSFEHIPPKSAFNKNNRFYTISSIDYYQNFEQYKNEKPNLKIEQGGLGEYCLCVNCNGFLGQMYVREYKKFSHIAMSILNKYEDNYVKSFEFDISDINLLKFLKQITSIFVCSNQPAFTNSYPELIDFIKKPELESLPDKYRFYMYLNNEGHIKNGKFHYTNIHGMVCEFVYPPFGFVLNIDNPNRIMEVTEITNFKHYNKIDKTRKLPIILNKYITHYPFPLDFRQKG
ncbi:hypothetical protein [uncultured Tenacibaculum sp.]|uniref:hypothetical protein n=1 Tax=uncultured Tenacibaculum sp. TaxID=174713 RepID=UPI002613BD07|nr:hypothetical protein [uncultured Tenacibaculum sp.]